MSRTVDLSVPISGQTCTPSNPIPNLPINLRNPILNYYRTTSLTPATIIQVCGMGVLTLDCYTHTLGSGGGWTKAATSSRKMHINVQPVKIDNKIYTCDDINNEVFNPATAEWSYEGAIPKTTFRTGGGSCCLVVGDYLYMIGGSKADLTNGNVYYVQRLQIDNTQSPPTLAPEWELLWKGTSPILRNPTCSPNPSNRGQIAIIPSVSNGNMYYFDTNFNTLKTATFPTTPSIDGADIMEVCADNTLYAEGSGAYKFTPATSLASTYPSGTWAPITGAGVVSRVYGTCILVKPTDFTTSCTGC
jgi:hypothetical protein